MTHQWLRERVWHFTLSHKSFMGSIPHAFPIKPPPCRDHDTDITCTLDHHEMDRCHVQILTKWPPLAPVEVGNMIRSNGYNYTQDGQLKYTFIWRYFSHRLCPILPQTHSAHRHIRGNPDNLLKVNPDNSGHYIAETLPLSNSYLLLSFLLLFLLLITWTTLLHFI